MSTAPSDAVAIETNSKSVLFYIDSSGFIKYLQGPIGGVEQQGDGANYETDFILLNGERVPVHDDFKTLAAVAYGGSNNTDSQIRIYFINKKKILEEICRTNEGNWFPGTLGPGDKQSSNTVASGSCITANVQQSSGQLKVFFTKKESAPKLSCTWVVLGQTNWITRTITPSTIVW